MASNGLKSKGLNYDTKILIEVKEKNTKTPHSNFLISIEMCMETVISVVS